MKIKINAVSKVWTQFDLGQLTIKIRVNEEKLKLVLTAIIWMFVNSK